MEKSASRFLRPVLLLPPLFLLAAAWLWAAGNESRETETRRLEVLFFGDDAYHHPLERYQIFKEVSGRRGINLTYEKRMEALNPENLAQYDVILVYANHQEITPEQLSALQNYVEDGGGFMPVHCGSACFKSNDDYVALTGGQIEGHDDGVFTARVVEPDHPAMKGYVPFETWDETYRHHRLTGDITVLQRHGDEPWTWVRHQGKGRVFYTAHGHDERCWHQEGFHELLDRGIRWAAGEGVEPPELPELRYETPLLPDRYQTDLPVPKVQEPLSPADSLKLAQVPPGFEISLFASEPDVIHPIAITWDERGRLWVVETLDYPNGLKSGDTGNDRLKICEDTDGDGKADRFTVFAGGLSIATSAVHTNGGVIVCDGPRMLFLKDTDGDDRADERTVLFEGFKMHDTHAGVSNLRYGFDGWIYATVGYAGFEGEVGGKPMKFDTGAFRFLPDGSALEFLGKTTNNTWGLGFTEQFDVLGSTANRQPSWQIVGDGGPTHRADRGTRFFPITLDVRQSDGWEAPLESLGDGRLRAKARHFTAAAGHAVYTAGLFPESWRNRTAFVCEPAGHLVSLGRLRTENADFITTFDGNNLYASADAWSAPVAAETGPDGAVWIADWYNIIVQHLRPGAPFEHTKVERGQGAGYLTPLREKPFGRIYRVLPANRTPESAPASLLEGLSHPNLFWRLNAQRLIVERKEDHLIPDLSRLASGSDGPAGDHALRALHALGQPVPTEFLRHPRPERRRTALSLWNATLPPDFDVVKESDPFVIREWLLLAARLPADESLGRQLRDWHRNAQHLRRGVVLDRCFAAAAARHASGFLLASLENPPDPSVLDERIYPAAIRSFAATHPPQILDALENDDSPLVRALKKAASQRTAEKTHPIPADRLARGSEVYERTCLACHQRDGSGVDAAFPPLDGSSRLNGPADIPARIILHGMTGPVEVPGKPAVNSIMPPVPGLSDEEIADVLTYARHAWSNDAPPVSAEEVRKTRASHSRRNSPWTAAELD